jgi:ribosomal-protein-alanine N-acetyltransferase
MVRTLQLYPLTNEYLPGAIVLDQLCFGGFWTIDGYRAEMERSSSDLLGLTNTDLGLLGLGCSWTILEEAHIILLAVHPDYRRQGLGHSLLWGLLDCARCRGQEWAILEVGASNEAALKLYTQFGFREVGRRKGYYADTHEDALILWCSGLQTPEVSERLVQQHQKGCDRLNQYGWHLDDPS